MAAFQTLLGLGTGRKPTPYKEIRGGADLCNAVQQRLSAIYWGDPVVSAKASAS
jgi:hypothetical protein